MQAIRVAAVQSSNMLANYLQDQLQADFAREELVKDGKLTAKKADEQQEEWEQVRFLFTWRDTKKAMMERVVRPLLKSYLRFATPEDRFYCRAFHDGRCNQRSKLGLLAVEFLTLFSVDRLNGTAD